MKPLYILSFFCVTTAQCNAQTKSIEKITAYIDSLYNITSDFKVDSIINLNLLTPEYIHNVGLLNYHQHRITKFYNYVSFNFYCFKTNEEAAGIFNNLISLSAEEPHKIEVSPIVAHIFPKGGSTYILYHNTIVMHQRRCNYMPIDNLREDAFIEFLFNGIYPKQNYYLQVDCGWDHPKVK